MTQIRNRTIIPQVRFRTCKKGADAITPLIPELIELDALIHQLTNFYHELASSLGLSDCAFNILYAVTELGDGCLQRDICRTTACPKQTVNSAMNRLVQSGILRMESGRRREMRIFLTGHGREFMQERFSAVVHIENSSYSSFTPAEWAEYIRLTKKHIDVPHRSRKTLSLSNARSCST